MNDILVALISGGITALVSLVGIILTNSKSTALLQYKVDELDKKVMKHNNLVERIYGVEKAVALNKQDIDALKDKKEGD